MTHLAVLSPLPLATKASCEDLEPLDSLLPTWESQKILGNFYYYYYYYYYFYYYPQRYSEIYHYYCPPKKLNWLPMNQTRERRAPGS